MCVHTSTSHLISYNVFGLLCNEVTICFVIEKVSYHNYYLTFKECLLLMPPPRAMSYYYEFLFVIQASSSYDCNWSDLVNMWTNDDFVFIWTRAKVVGYEMLDAATSHLQVHLSAHDKLFLGPSNFNLRISMLLLESNLLFFQKFFKLNTGWQFILKISKTSLICSWIAVLSCRFLW